MGNSLPIIILVLFFIVLMVITTNKQKKSMEEAEKVSNSLKIGDKVKTHLGIYGTIVDFYETSDGRIVCLNIGRTTDCIIEVSSKMLAGLDNKQIFTLDEEGNVIAIDGVPVENEKKEENQEVKEENKEPEKIEENENVESDLKNENENISM